MAKNIIPLSSREILISARLELAKINKRQERENIVNKLLYKDKNQNEKTNRF